MHQHSVFSCHFDNFANRVGKKNGLNDCFLPIISYICSKKQGAMKVQRIMIDAGFSCPNRDGTVSTGGCTFCRTESFNPAYCHGSIREQIEAGKRFFGQKYRNMKYAAYFQAYSNTFAPIPILRERYEEALSCDDIDALVIATRPDCLSEEILSYLSDIKHRGYDVSIEIGIESLYDDTLRRINRGHSAQQTCEAIRQCAEAGLDVGGHLIIGLPGETEDLILHEASLLNALPLSYLKLHQLQILKDTKMAEEWKSRREDFHVTELPAYVSLLKSFLSLLRPDIRIERYASSAPASLLIAPRWGLKPAEIARQITNLV